MREQAKNTKAWKRKPQDPEHKKVNTRGWVKGVPRMKGKGDLKTVTLEEFQKSGRPGCSKMAPGTTSPRR